MSGYWIGGHEGDACGRIWLTKDMCIFETECTECGTVIGETEDCYLAEYHTPFCSVECAKNFYGAQ
jgi:hypothetical protein